MKKDLGIKPYLFPMPVLMIATYGENGSVDVMNMAWNIQKKPSTSEVIDWIRALELGGVPASKIKEAVPFAGVLLKKNEDIDTMRKFLK